MRCIGGLVVVLRGERKQKQEDCASRLQALSGGYWRFECRFGDGSLSKLNLFANFGEQATPRKAPHLNLYWTIMVSTTEWAANEVSLECWWVFLTLRLNANKP